MSVPRGDQTTARKRTTKRPEDRRADLLAAGARVFAAKGVAASTVADVAEDAGVAKGTFYLYFDSKDDLLREMLQRFFAGFLERTAAFLAQIDATEEWWPTVDRLVADLVDYDLAHPELHLVVHELVIAGTADLLDACHQQVLELMVAGVRRGMAAGRCHADDPELTAALLYHAVEGVVHDALAGRLPGDRDRLVTAVQTLVRKALAAPR